MIFSDLSSPAEAGFAKRSEERRVGKKCRSRWSPDHLKKEATVVQARAEAQRLATEIEQRDPAIRRDYTARVDGLSVFFSSRRRHTRCLSDWSSDVCSSDLSGGDQGHEHWNQLRLGNHVYS